MFPIKFCTYVQQLLCTCVTVCECVNCEGESVKGYTLTTQSCHGNYYTFDSLREKVFSGFCSGILVKMFSAIPEGGGKEGRGGKDGRGRGREGMRGGGSGKGGRREETGIIQREIESKEHTTTYMYILSHTSTQRRVVQFPFHSFLPMVHWDGMDSGI